MGNWGLHIRQLREKRGISLRELSRLSELSAAALSAIENDQSSPTLATLHKLLKALGTDFSSFFYTAQLQDESPVFPAASMRTINDAHRLCRFLFPARTDIRFEALVETISADEGESEWKTHDCDMGGFLLEGGPLTLDIRGKGSWTVGAGDAFYVRALQPHRAVNAGTGPARLITIFDPPRY